jgi:putative transposase
MTTELDRRKEAVRLYLYDGRSKASICRQLNCSRPWLNRWLERYDPDDVDGSLSDRSRAPKQPASPWSAAVRQRVTEMRRQRSDRETHPYALIGAAAIHFELRALGSPEVPPTRTIHSWLVAEDLVPPRETTDEPREPKPIPLPMAEAVNDVHQLDLKGPFYRHGSSTKHYLATLRDRCSQRCALAPLLSRKAEGIADCLVAGWQRLGLPKYLQLDNGLELRGSNRYPRSFGRVVRVALDLGVEPVFIPPSEPWRNGCVERFHGFLEDRLLAVEFADFQALVEETQTCQDTCNQTHRLEALDGLTPDEYAAQAEVRLLPAEYRRHRAETLPQDKGFVSFVRLVRRSGRITLVVDDRFMVDPDLAYNYVLARVDLTERQVAISHNGELIVTYDYSPDTVGAWADGPVVSDC